MLEALVDFVFGLLFAAILARVLLSYIVPLAGSRPHPILISIHRLVFQVTEPILGPIRRYTTFGVFDFSPMVALLVLTFIWRVVS